MKQLKAWAAANKMIADLKAALPGLLTKDEKLKLLETFKTLIGHCKLSEYVAPVIDELEAEINAAS